MRVARVFRHVFLVTIATTFGASAVTAQSLEDFTVNGAAVERTKVRDEISLATARRIADHCLENAASRDLGVSIFILSPSGHVVYALRSDGQRPPNIETALLKAKTALYMRDSTHMMANRFEQNPASEVRDLPLGQFWNSGGLPIIVDGIMIGAIGVGGMRPTAEWNDELCAHQALTAVLGPQPPLAPFLE